MLISYTTMYYLSRRKPFKDLTVTIFRQLLSSGDTSKNCTLTIFHQLFSGGNHSKYCSVNIRSVVA